MVLAQSEREKWNWPTLTSSETSKVRLSANPNIDMPDTKRIPLLAKGERFLNDGM